MKIAILTPTFVKYSGIDRVVENQAKDLTKKGHNVTVFTFKSALKPDKFQVVEWGMPKTLFQQRLFRLFFIFNKKKINEYSSYLKDFDKVISHMYPMNLIAGQAKKRYKTKYIFYNHGVGHPKLFQNPLEKLYMKLFIRFNNTSLKNVDEAISISKYMQSELKKESNLDSKVVYNKIDQKKFNKNVNGDNIRKKYNLNDKKILFFIGRLSPHKGVHLLLKAFDIINKEEPNARLLIVGKRTFEKYYKKLKKLANKNTIFIEEIPDKELPEYYAACDVYLTATLWEGFNLPVAEVQACGKPVVAFDIGPHKEIVKNGILVKEKDINAFADAVIKSTR